MKDTNEIKVAAHYRNDQISVDDHADSRLRCGIGSQELPRSRSLGVGLIIHRECTKWVANVRTYRFIPFRSLRSSGKSIEATEAVPLDWRFWANGVSPVFLSSRISHEHLRTPWSRIGPRSFAGRSCYAP